MPKLVQRHTVYGQFSKSINAILFKVFHYSKKCDRNFNITIAKEALPSEISCY